MQLNPQKFVGRQSEFCSVGSWIKLSKKKVILSPKLIENSLPSNIKQKAFKHFHDSDKKSINASISIVLNKPILILMPCIAKCSTDPNLKTVVVSYSTLMPFTNIPESFKDVFVNGDIDSSFDELSYYYGEADDD